MRICSTPKVIRNLSITSKAFCRAAGQQGDTGRTPIGQFPADVANRLLEDADDQVLGSWVKQGPVAMFVVKVDADTYGSRLHDAISAAAVAADTLEEELTGADEF